MKIKLHVNYSSQPWKAQVQLRKVMTQLYDASPQGYPRDEDQGGLSSWYVLSALGIYSVCPGTDQYVIGSPMFKKATIKLENGNEFVIEADNNSAENVYIDSAALNGNSLSKNWITYDDIIKGGTLHFSMSSQPNKKRGTAAEDVPFLLSKN